MTDRFELRGRLVLEDRVAVGRLAIEDGWIAAVDLDDDRPASGAPDDLPYLAPGFVDVHVHGWGGHDAMGDAAALDGMARALLRHGVTSFLPTGVTNPLPDPPRVGRPGPSVDPACRRRRRGSGGVQHRGPVHLAGQEGRPQPGPPAEPGRRPVVGHRAARRGSHGHDRRPGDPGRPRADPAAHGPRSPRLDRTLGGRSGRGARRVRRGRRDDDPSLQRDERGRSSGAGRRGRGPRPRRRVGRADRRRQSRPSGPLEDHRALEARGPADAHLATPCRWPGWAMGG